MANKVKYGLQNVYYAVATIDAANHTATYGTPVAIPGAVSLSLTAEGDQTKFRADNIDYWIGTANNGYSGDLEIALIPKSFKTAILGMQESGGALVETVDANAVPFALLFQFEGDANATRHVLYNCTAARPQISGQTTQETIEPQTETLSLTASSIYNTTLQKEIVKASVENDTEGATVYAGWTGEVWQPA